MIIFCRRGECKQPCGDCVGHQPDMVGSEHEGLGSSAHTVQVCRQHDGVCQLTPHDEPSQQTGHHCRTFQCQVNNVYIIMNKNVVYGESFHSVSF